MLHRRNIFDPSVRAEQLFLFGSKELLCFGSGAKGLISCTVNIEATFRCIVLTLELLDAARPAFTMKDLRHFVFLQLVRREIGKLVE